MDKKLEIKQAKVDEYPSQYKKLSDADIELGNVNDNIKRLTNGQTNSASNDIDDRKSTENDVLLQEANGVKIVSSKSNGDDKLDLTSTFGGLAKEELLKYANDPFWVRLRWILFILFWLTWVLMLIGAIGIIITAPKCVSLTPKKWFEEGPLVELEYENVNAQLAAYLKNNGVTGVIVNMPNDYDPYDNNDTSILSAFRDNGINAIIDLKPGSSNKWLNRAFDTTTNDTQYSEYYVRGKAKNGAEPNNWKSILGGSAWKQSPIEGVYYLAQVTTSADLNFRNTLVVEEFKRVIERWLSAGAKGVRLIGADRLIVDDQLRDESIAGFNDMPPGSGFDRYEFFSHKYTRNLDGIAQILKQWRDLIMNATDEDGVLMIKEDIETLQPYTSDGVLTIDLPKHSNVFTMADQTANASLISQGILAANLILDNNWPSWQVNSTSSDNDALNLLIIALPGTPIYKHSAFNLTSHLIKLRLSPTVLFGEFKSHLLENNTVLVYVREKAGNPRYLTVFNPLDVSVETNLAFDDDVNELTVYAASVNYNNHTSIIPKAKITPKQTLAPKSTLILTYVAKK